MNNKIDYSRKREIEEVFEAYLEAFENRDTQAMEAVWSGQDTDRILSVLGTFSGQEIISGLMDSVIKEKFSGLYVADSSIDVLFMDEATAFASASFQVVMAQTDTTKAINQQILESQIYKKMEDGWKLCYVHQSIQVPYTSLMEPSRQEEILTSMLEWILEQNGQSQPIPRSLKDKLELLKSQMQIFHGQPDENYLDLQKVFLEEYKRNTPVGVVPFILGDTEKFGVWQGNPAALAVDGLISFLPDKQYCDAQICLGSGLEMQCDIEAIQDLKPRQILSLGGYHLPVKGIIEVILPPVYGLLTKAKKEAIHTAIQDALKEAANKGYKTLAFTSAWKEQLNIPLSYAPILVEDILYALPEGVENVIFTANRADEKKALNKALDAWNKAQTA